MYYVNIYYFGIVVDGAGRFLKRILAVLLHSENGKYQNSIQCLRTKSPYFSRLFHFKSLAFQHLDNVQFQQQQVTATPAQCLTAVTHP